MPDAIGDGSRAVVGRRRGLFSGRGYGDAGVRPGAAASGDAFAGPAIVEQLDSTTVVWPGQRAAVDESLNLLLTRG